jgi:hypothetical protein
MSFRSAAPCLTGVFRTMKFNRSFFSTLAIITRTSSISLADESIALSSKTHTGALSPAVCSFAWKREAEPFSTCSLGPTTSAQWYLLITSSASDMLCDLRHAYGVARWFCLQVFLAGHLGCSTSDIECNIKTIFFGWHIWSEEHDLKAKTMCNRMIRIFSLTVITMNAAFGHSVGRIHSLYGLLRRNYELYFWSASWPALQRVSESAGNVEDALHISEYSSPLA